MRQRDENEKEQMRRAMNDNRDLLDRLDYENKKKQNFIDQLKHQIKEKEMRKLREKEEQEKLNREIPGYMFDESH